jgi:hypothetical protein
MSDLVRGGNARDANGRDGRKIRAAARIEKAA